MVARLPARIPLLHLSLALPLGLALSLSVGCAESAPGTGPGFGDEAGAPEEITLVFPAVHASDSPDEEDPGICGCDGDAVCMDQWANDSLGCGVCLTVTCGEDTAYVCTDLCSGSLMDPLQRPVIHMNL